MDIAIKYAGAMRAVFNYGGNPLHSQSYGDFVVANLGAHWQPDAAGHHRVGVRVENLFDTDYATRIRSAVLAGSSPAQRFIYRNLGAPRTGYLSYSYTF
jgi:vitamin B12 transporter